MQPPLRVTVSVFALLSIAADRRLGATTILDGGTTRIDVQPETLRENAERHGVWVPLPARWVIDQGRALVHFTRSAYGLASWRSTEPWRKLGQGLYPDAAVTEPSELL